MRKLSKERSVLGVWCRVTFSDPGAQDHIEFHDAAQIAKREADLPVEVILLSLIGTVRPGFERQ